MPIKERVEELFRRIDAAAARSGRAGKDIMLVAVTKGAAPEAVREAYAAGLRCFGENRVQEAAEKIPLLSDLGAEWHMIGHLQTNKIKAALPLFGLVQSVDSVRLAKEISQEAVAGGRTVPVLLEVKISDEPKKFGFKPEEVYAAIGEIAGLAGLQVKGLMAIGPGGVEDAAKRQAFAKLRNVFSVCKSLKYPNVEMKCLSMGMSDDFELAIEEKANMIRVGRAIFG